MAFEIVDGMTGTKHISSDDLAALNIATVGKADCVLGYGEDFKLTMASSASATLGTGVGMVGGRRFWSASRVSLDIQPGEQGRKRNDLVVARYSTTSEGIEGIQPVVIGGTPTTGTPADPDTTSDDLKLWRIPLDGISIGEPVRLFDPVIPLAALGDSVSQLRCRAARGLKFSLNQGWTRWRMNQLDAFSDIDLSAFKFVALTVSASTVNGAGVECNWNTWNGNCHIDIYTPVAQDVFVNAMVWY